MARVRLRPKRAVEIPAGMCCRPKVRDKKSGETLLDVKLFCGEDDLPNKQMHLLLGHTSQTAQPCRLSWLATKEPAVLAGRCGVPMLIVQACFVR